MLKKIFLTGLIISVFYLVSSIETFAHSVPKTKAVAVTPSDTVDLTTQGILYIGGVGSGNLKVVTSGGTTVVFIGVTVGWIEHLRVKRVFSTGTDVTNIVVAYR